MNINSDLVLCEDIILQRCEALGLSSPTYIIETSENHLQCPWDFKNELYLYKNSILDYWKLVQVSIYEPFRDLGAAPVFVTDPTCYLRNPNKKYGINKKYSHRPKVKLVYEGDEVDMSDLYYALKEAGLVNQ